MKRARGGAEARAKLVHPHAWIWEALEDDATFVLGSMFGTRIAYLDGLLMLCFATKEEPWHGILVCTERGQHASLMAQFAPLAPHPVLGKWLYLSESADAFEKVAVRLAAAAKARDPRIGVIPGKRRSERP
ncbi:MAG TPA: hypothetical protein VFE25_05410 [Opitutaceae bacterium]|nr:hypothetical protein [Opitutaceae bacterium]